MIITNGKIVTWGDPNEILEDKALLIQDGLIQEIGTEAELKASHPSEEILLLEQGQLDVLVESETTRLNAGDTTVVQSNLPHIVSNPGDTTAVGLAVFTPAIWFPNNRRSFNRGGET